MKPAERAVHAYQQASKKVPDGSAAANSTDPKEERQMHLLLKGSESGARRAAKFLMLLPKDEASKILNELTASEVERVVVEIARIRKIEVSEARTILDEFGKLGARGGTKRGGPDVAREMLSRAFGNDRGDELFYRTVPTGRINPFDFLDELEFQQILSTLKNEPAAVVSVVLAHMQPDKAALVLEALHPELQREVSLRISRMCKLDPEAIGHVAEALRERVRRQGKIVTEEIDGRSALADILRYLPSEIEDAVIQDLERYDEQLSKDIQERLLTIEVVFHLRDTDLQSILRDFSEAEIAVVLKGKKEEIRERIFSNISERRSTLVRDEMERLGPMKRSEVAEATKELLLYIKDLEDEGRVVIDTEDEYLVD